MWIAIFASISDELATFIRSALLSGDVLATIAVGCGIVWESGPLEVHHVAHRLVIWGIVAETLCTIGLFVFDNGMNDVQVDVIRAQQATIIELNKKVAENQELLMWQQMPRMLNNVTGCRKILRASPKGAKVRIVWRSDVSDGQSFAWFIGTCFLDPEQRSFPPKWDIENGEPVEKLPDGASRDGVTVISNTLDNWLISPSTPAGFVTKGLFEGAPLHKGISFWRDTTLPNEEVIIAIGPKLP